MTTLYISDLDGTLLGSDARISATSARIISDLSQRGALITVATARTPATVVPLLRDTFTTPPAIVMTGAALWHRNTASYSDVHLLSPLQLSSVLRICSEAKITPFVYTIDSQRNHIEVYHEAPRLNSDEQNFVDQRKHLPLKHFNFATRVPPHTDSCILIFGMGPWENVTAAAQAIGRECTCSVSCYPDTYTPGLGLIEVFAQGVSKAAAVRHLRQITCADRVVVFGDNLNDLPMMQEADVAVAVENAVPQVRSFANIVIGENTNDAVARFIEADFLETLSASAKF